MKNKKLDALDRKGNFRHEQHTEKFIKELNTPTNKKSQPFRMTDGIMMIGKHKGKHISEIPENYLKWLIENYNGLTIGSKQIINNHLTSKTE